MVEDFSSKKKVKKKKSYADKLPRLTKGHKCQALDDDGNKCRCNAKIETFVFLDDGTYWITANLCEKCATDDDMRKAITRYYEENRNKK